MIRLNKSIKNKVLFNCKLILILKKKERFISNKYLKSMRINYKIISKMISYKIILKIKCNKKELCFAFKSTINL